MTSCLVAVVLFVPQSANLKAKSTDKSLILKMKVNVEKEKNYTYPIQQIVWFYAGDF